MSSKAIIFDIDGTLSPEVSWLALTRDLGASVEEHIQIYKNYKEGKLLTKNPSTNSLVFGEQLATPISLSSKSYLKAGHSTLKPNMSLTMPEKIIPFA